ncbi:P-loop containing nucleoside triphosphate hydrolase protein [Cylindrobasidium torrendii FP15055 ss-10]|uniref:p-loop containing nucleoside triphosphate hydrolase protein n=1 Tax=Cylindrobasidium torrendii FP15055 ss-10 TaxID=1314674 RepID=A0A0D7AXG9_9AGAR|nr:P-loop containing nucleoside triphosphate hydrolase protein [Cylindrobasidium torrendii FP15055 ss-10]
MFAIASDDPEEVRRVLATGEAGPNDNVGPQSALAFTLGNDQLAHKLDIVKVLLEYGADTSELKDQDQALAKVLMDQVDDATRYYLSKAETALTRKTDALMKRSSFKPIAKLRYGIIGQDRALEQLFRVLSMHNQKISTTPIVMLLCGPSGYGKSLLAQKFGGLLDVPTHTVNMTTLRSAHDLWQSYSITPELNGNSRCTLVEFLINNEGKRAIVVLDEIEKTKEDSVLWSLLLPWESGRCSFEANSMNIDVRNVVWLGTSNIGQDLIFEHHTKLHKPEEVMTRNEYVELMGSVRPRVSDRLGASVLSRVTTILPFVPFTMEEKRALASEALSGISSDITAELGREAMQGVVDGALEEFIPEEGARSIYRAVSSLVVDAMDLI